ncbi:preprotein translocase subunit SecA [Stieleria neptunia]|uniref:Protein translocase subunit SecA n=1 Tax=Stieleria neptunia TaxID=2527979 RepID=A0A518I404_9BACT|nr:preprotein translocase subunit SecA [Stieleria neptunia]QDV47835.1 preprotein translocase subunit SecA [Stieleria neptunia]
MFQSRPCIANYRGITGQPKRGVQSVGKSTQDWIQRVRARGRQLESLDDQSFRASAARCRDRIRVRDDAVVLDNTIESFALTGEALRRTTGMSYYDVQLCGGFVLAAGTIAEIQTGEGKTITTALPTVLHAWSGRGVHVATTNDYLSSRDHDELKPVYDMLGFSVGLLQPQGPVEEKIEAYACDITYGPGYEFGFDFLKDQLAIRSRHQTRLGERFLRSLQGIDSHEATPAQRGHAFAIIDEADSVLIDEATTPLILAGGKSSAATSPALYQFARRISLDLSEDDDYIIDPIKRTIRLTPDGWKRIHQRFDSRPPGQLARPWSQLIENALRAERILQCDVDYVVQEGQVMIVDPNTGRIHDERKWSSGLHQAVEAKEQVEMTDENETHARITRQRYIGFYDGVAGLTGTASDSESELREFYRLPVVRIETNKPCVRQHLPLRCFDSCRNKFDAIADDAAGRSRRGQPVLIGTGTIQESKLLSRRLSEQGISHVVLNGLQDDEEASIVRRAGVSGAVTVATNMAGRGTDIKPDAGALAAGGLHVAAASMHACQRVDRQLAGRAARQGDPGSCQFYAAADDELIQSRGPDLAAEMIASAGPTGECRKDFSVALRRIQRQAEADALVQRQRMVAHDDWMESVQSSLARRA